MPTRIQAGNHEAIGAHDLHLVVDEQARLSAVQVSANAAAIERRRSNGMEPFRRHGIEEVVLALFAAFVPLRNSIGEHAFREA